MGICTGEIVVWWSFFEGEGERNERKRLESKYPSLSDHFYDDENVASRSSLSQSIFPGTVDLFLVVGVDNVRITKEKISDWSRLSIRRTED